MLANNTNENKQFWPKYKIINITGVSNISFYWKNCKFIILALFTGWIWSNRKSMYLPILQTHLIGKKVVGAPVAQVVSSHRALKKQQK